MGLAKCSIGLVIIGLVLASRTVVASELEDLRKMAGTWIMFDMEVNGHGTARCEVKRIVFDKNRYTFYHEQKASGESIVNLGTKTDPRTIDLSKDGKASQGIYRFKDGRLEICLAQEGKPRPSVFATWGEPGAGSILYVLKPLKPPMKLDPVEAEYQAELKKMSGKWEATKRELGGRADKEPSERGLLVEDGYFSSLFKGKERDTMKAIRINSRADPPEIDFRTGNGKIWIGIYKVADDSLEICLPSIDATKRPTAFATGAEPGAGQTNTAYKKDK